ncbi:hypothetical protein GH733_005574 [Mirounga leonina]|nr:hypothetical protein GH733_005574 [Mirounga leonina]
MTSTFQYLYVPSSLKLLLPPWPTGNPLMALLQTVNFPFYNMTRLQLPDGNPDSASATRIRAAGRFFYLQTAPSSLQSVNVDSLLTGCSRRPLRAQILTTNSPVLVMSPSKGGFCLVLVTKIKMQRILVIHQDYLHYIQKDNHFEKHHKNMFMHLLPCFRDVQIGDIVMVGEFQSLNKTRVHGVEECVCQDRKRGGTGLAVNPALVNC